MLLVYFLPKYSDRYGSDCHSALTFHCVVCLTLKATRCLSAHCVQAEERARRDALEAIDEGARREREEREEAQRVEYEAHVAREKEERERRVREEQERLRPALEAAAAAQKEKVLSRLDSVDFVE